MCILSALLIQKRFSLSHLFEQVPHRSFPGGGCTALFPHAFPKINHLKINSRVIYCCSFQPRLGLKRRFVPCEHQTLSPAALILAFIPGWTGTLLTPAPSLLTPGLCDPLSSLLGWNSSALAFQCGLNSSLLSPEMGLSIHPATHHKEGGTADANQKTFWGG